MWSLKFKVENLDSIYTVLTKKYNVTDYFYPVDRYKKGNNILILGIHILEGEEKDKKSFVNELKKNTKVLKFECNKNMLIVLIKEEEKFYELLYNPELYLTHPVTAKQGYEYWNVSSWDRTLLEGLIKEIEKWKEKLKNFQLQSIQKTNLNDIYFPKLSPELPEKQKQAFEIAIKNNYYTFPRKVDLSDLAKIMKISTSTYQEHLRKAEAKLLPFFAENLK
ncbi:MAG: helix-turn-helix domain-containing protein [Candidatus Pacearchaeota archaeon]|jgi:predicted DNA binding protein